MLYNVFSGRVIQLLTVLAQMNRIEEPGNAVEQSLVCMFLKTQFSVA